MFVGLQAEDALNLSVYTKIGDQGKTTFFGCGLVSKDDIRIEALGALDELNCVIGITLCFVEDHRLKQILEKIQNDLFQVGSDIAGSELEKGKLPFIHQNHITELEKLIDDLEKELGMPKTFIMPKGNFTGSFLHLCRSVTRRSERILVTLKKVVPHINPDMLRYINRLSDLLFCLARYANRELEIKDQEPMYKYL